jgi:hypothetical protein
MEIFECAGQTPWNETVTQKTFHSTVIKIDKWENPINGREDYY